MFIKINASTNLRFQSKAWCWVNGLFCRDTEVGLLMPEHLSPSSHHALYLWGVTARYFHHFRSESHCVKFSKPHKRFQCFCHAINSIKLFFKKNMFIVKFWIIVLLPIRNDSHLFVQISWIQTKQPQWSRGRVSALRLGGCGFDHRPRHTNDYKNGAHCLTAWHSVFGVGLGEGFRSPNNSWVQHRSCPPLPQGVKCWGQIARPLACDTHWDFNLWSKKAKPVQWPQLNPSTLRRPGRLQIISETLRTKNSNPGLCFCLSVSVGMQINRVYPFFVFNDQDRKFAINPHACPVARWSFY